MIFSDHNGMKSIAGRTYTGIWKLNSTLLNNQWLGQRRNQFHENEKTIYQNLWNAKTNNNHHLAACIKYNFIYVFQQRGKPSHLLLPKKESTNQIQAEYLPAQELLLENKTIVSPPPPHQQETLQMTRRNRNNSSTTEENTVPACQLKFSRIFDPAANLPRTGELLSFSPNLNSPGEELSSHEIILFFGRHPSTIPEL